MSDDSISGFELSPPQGHLWKLTRGGRVSGFHSWAAVRLEGALDLERLRRALGDLVAEYEVLRTDFRLLPGLAVPLQMVRDPEADPYANLEAHPLEADAAVPVVEALLDRVLPCEITPTEGDPVLGAALGVLGAEEHLLVLALPASHADRATWPHLLEALARHYGGEASAEEGEEPAQYPDLAGWRNDLLAAEGVQANVSYWCHHRLPGLAQRALPFEGRRTSEEAFAPRALQVALAPHLGPRLRETSTGLDVPVKALLLAAWQLLLERLGADPPPVVGVLSDGRSEEEVAQAVGPLSTFLPLALDVRPRESFAGLAARGAEALAQHEEFHELFLRSAPEESPHEDDFPPFAQEHTVEPEAVQVGALRVSLVRTEARIDRFKIKLVTTEGAAGFTARLEYDPDLLSRYQLQAMAEQFHTLLEGALATPERAVGELSPLSAAAHHRLVCELNDVARPFRDDALLHRLVEEQAMRTPGEVALVFAGGEWTYGEMVERADRLAGWLHRAGVGPESRVGVCLERSPELIMVLLGVLRAGGTYVPLDPSWPTERLALMLRDSAAELVVTRERWVDHLGVEAYVYTLEAGEHEGAALLAAAEMPELCGEHAAYVLFTSGSTGRPKGVVMSHRAICNRLLWMGARFDFRPTDRLLQKTPFHFDASIWEIFLPLWHGARLVLARPDGHGDPAHLVDLMTRWEVTLLQVVPSQLQLLVGEPGLGECRHLRRVWSGGEKLSADARDRLHARVDVELVNLYGPTETAIDATAWPCRRRAADGEVMPIGRPISNAVVYVVAPDLILCPPEVPGELLIGGAGVARGYVGQPARTAERFLPDPWSGRPGARLYRSGDITRLRPDGSLAVLGRSDHQVKLRGLRIELGEIEATLTRFPGVLQAVAAVREDTPGEQRLVAYVVAEDGFDLDIGTLRTFLTGILPAYMVPAVFLPLDELPRLPNGKIDRHSLPPVEDRALRSHRVYVAPRNATEEKLAEIWREILGLERVSVEDNFYELGGDSILLLRVVARIRSAGLTLDNRRALQHHTVAELAAAIEAGGSQTRPAEVVAGPVPLTPIQHDFIARELADPDHYNQGVLLTPRLALAPPRWQKLVRVLHEHHDSLRLRLEHAEGEWRQLYVPEKGLAPPFTAVDLGALPAASFQEALERAAGQVQASLDLRRGPLFRVVLFRGGAVHGERLLVVIHHLAVDGVSWRILLEDLENLLAAAGRGEVFRLPEKTTSFGGWSRRLRSLVPTLEDEIDYWTAPARRKVASLPVDRQPRVGGNREGSAEMVSVSLSPSETRDLLQGLPRGTGLRTEEILLAALAECLGRWTGQRAHLVDLEGHGRQELLFDEVDLSRTVGWFTTVYPVLLSSPQGASAGEILRRTKEELRRIPRQGLGYGVLRYLGGEEVRSELAEPSAAEISFNYLGRFEDVLAEEGLLASAEESSGRGQSLRQGRRYLLDVTALSAGGQLTTNWSYSRDVHERATIEALADSCLAALRRLLAYCLDPAARLRTPTDFPLVEWLDQATIDRLAAGELPLEDLYPLSPLQQGLLLHAHDNPETGAYFQQISCRLGGVVDVEMLRRTWQHLVDRHAILRTAFEWRDLEAPLQVVRRNVDLVWEVQDWTGVAAEDEAESLERFWAEDRRRGFDFECAPLIRLTLLRLSGGRFELVLSSHHLVLDGWSGPLLLQEFFDIYEALRHGRSVNLPPRPGYRDFIAWLRKQDLEASREYWRQVLAGFTEPTPIGAALDKAAAGQRGQITTELSEELSSDLRNLAQELKVSLGTLMKALWSLLLGRLSGRDDLVFGMVVAGRPATLEGSDDIVGMFVNSLPVRVKIDPAALLPEWLEALNEAQIRLREHEHCPLAMVQRWSEVPVGVSLFESTFAFNNYPTNNYPTPGVKGTDEETLELERLHWAEQSSYPLDLTIGMGRRLGLRLMFDRSRLRNSEMERLMAGLERLAKAVLEEPRQTVESLQRLLEQLETSSRISKKGEKPMAKSPMFKKIKPKAVRRSALDAIRKEYLDAATETLPILQPKEGDVDVVELIRTERSQLEKELRRHGALLFRGFEIHEPGIFERFAAGFCDELFNENGEHPRDSVSGNVYTPVFYPPEKNLLWHNENSFNLSWPLKILFCASQPAEEGGETPVVDSRRVFEDLDPAVREPFVEKGVTYVRNYGGGVGLDWQTVFQTEDRAEVERRCTLGRMEWEWNDGDRLKTLARRPAVIRHPVTGEISWFNQAQHWHTFCLDDETRQSMKEIFQPGDEPRYCLYGDGSEIPDEAMTHILDTYRRLEVAFPWERGDVMVVDNVLAAHGRNAFKGPRKLLVALGDMRSFDETVAFDRNTVRAG